ncbi:MAG: chromate transporter [Ruminococcaceae bacterium]|nr:chromate transporter [Oscillospiraceae bacterium]
MTKKHSLWELFITYLKIGLFTFGGGYAMIALIEDEVSTKKKWISKEELADIVTIAESTPGPIAINSATYVGYKMNGVIGSVVATAGVVIPSFVIIYTISMFFDLFMSFEIVEYAFHGIKCAVGLIILRTGWKMIKSFKRTPLHWILFAVSIIGITLINLFALKFSSVYFVLVGAVIGLFVYLLDRNKEKVDSEKGGAGK